MPEQQNPYTITYAQIAVTLAGMVLVGGMLAYYFFVAPPPAAPVPELPLYEATLSDAIRSGTAKRPPITEAMTIKALAKTKGFQALVSYTDRGFEPRAVKIKQGQTVRFTNNSSLDLRVVQSGVAAGDICDPASLDSCNPIAPQAFWEFTFPTAGEWSVENAFDSAKIGTVQVE